MKLTDEQLAALEDMRESLGSICIHAKAINLLIHAHRLPILPLMLAPNLSMLQQRIDHAIFEHEAEKTREAL
jgi:hypothetical protein